MSALAYVLAAAAFVVGAGLGGLVGFYFGRRGASAAVIQASAAVEVEAAKTEIAEKAAINAEADKLVSAIPAMTPEQVIEELENLK